MSQVVRRASGMRIIALPLTVNTRTSEHLTYFHFQTPPPKTPPATNVVQKATSKAAGAWAAMGKAPEGSWKHRIFKYGERLVDRVDFEELALKSIDPSLGPQVLKLGDSDVKVDVTEKPSIPLVHPTILAAASSPLAHLRILLTKRIPLHRKGFYTWMIIAPFTAPFAIVPVIPNLPFFFCVWRSWSHYKAYKASAYLDSLVDQNIIVPEVNTDLDEIYVKFAPPPQPPGISDASDGASGALKAASDPEERALLTREAIPPIVTMFALPPTAASDLYRAMDQAVTRMTKRFRTV